jgi:hypothetical protein
MSEATSTRSGVNLIPSEVRQMIWLQSLVPNEHVKISYSRGWSPSTDSHGKPQAQVVKSQIPAPSILRLSKNFHEEAEEVLYKFNVFEFKGSLAIDDLVLFPSVRQFLH